MITYGDAFLLLQNDESSGTQLDEWLRKYLPIDQFVDQLEETAQMRSGRQAQSRAAAFDGGQVAMRGVAPLNYPPAPKMRLNTLWWPTGAARWGRFYGLIDGNSLEELTSSMPVPKPLALVINDPTNDTEIIAERMWMLQPRKLNPIEAVADTPYVDLWLLPLVDDRYYWQMIAYNLLINPIVTTWRDLFTLLVIGLLGFTAGISIDLPWTAYMQPDVAELGRHWDNLAQVFDACCHSVGSRYIHNLDGTGKVADWISSETLYGENETDNLDIPRIAGSDFSLGFQRGILPENVQVVFPAWREGRPDPLGAIQHLDNPFSQGVKGTEKVIHSTAYADFTGQVPAGTPLNLTDLDLLANQITEDYFSAQTFQYDISYPGIFEWTISGYDDAVEWCFGYRDDMGYRAYTRAHSRPYNFGEEIQLSQNFNGITPVLAPYQLGILTQDLVMPGGTGSYPPGDPPPGPVPGKPAQCKLMTAGNPTQETPQEIDNPAKILYVNAWGWMFAGTKTIPSGTVVELRYIEELYAWYIVGTLESARDVWGTINSTIDQNHPSADVTVTRFCNGFFPGPFITGYIDETGAGQTILSRKAVRCLWDDMNRKYWIVSWIC